GGRRSSVNSEASASSAWGGRSGPKATVAIGSSSTAAGDELQDLAGQIGFLAASHGSRLVTDYRPAAGDAKKDPTVRRRGGVAAVYEPDRPPAGPHGGHHRSGIGGKCRWRYQRFVETHSVGMSPRVAA